MSFTLRVGLPRSTKSYGMIEDLYYKVKRNARWYKNGKTKEKRQITYNGTLQEEFLENYKDFIVLYRPEDEEAFRKEVIYSRDRDHFIDEISNYFDADNHANIPLDYKIFLNQYAKRGNTITCTTQDAGQLYTRARRKVTRVLMHTKLMGSPSPSPMRPKIKFIWGLYVTVQYRFKMSPDGQNLELKRVSLIPIPFPHFISSSITKLYDTREEINKVTKTFLQYYEFYCSEHYQNPYHTPEERAKRGLKPVKWYDQPVKHVHK